MQAAHTLLTCCAHDHNVGHNRRNTGGAGHLCQQLLVSGISLTCLQSQSGPKSSACRAAAHVCAGHGLRGCLLTVLSADTCTAVLAVLTAHRQQQANDEASAWRAASCCCCRHSIAAGPDSLQDGQLPVLQQCPSPAGAGEVPLNPANSRVHPRLSQSS